MAIDIELLKKRKKELGLSYDDLAQATGYSRSTITNIFCGYVDFPRAETMDELYRVLGITQEVPAPIYTEEERKLFGLIEQLTDAEVEELSNFVDFILSKRK